MYRIVKGSGWIIPLFLQLILFFLTSCVLEDEYFDAWEDETFDTWEDENGSYSLIWNQSPHCAFTDLIEYNGKVYCTFREANTHLPGDVSEYGNIRLLESYDGNSWKSVGIISDTFYDLRDPKLSVTPEGRLMLLWGRYSLDNDSRHPWTMMKFINDAELDVGMLTDNDIHEISIDNDVTLSNYWLWRVKWINGIAYGVAYKNGKLPILVKSTDGIHYSVVKTLNVGGNEADVELMSDGNMLIVFRAQDGKGKGYIGIAKPPFTNWQWSETTSSIHCPKIISIEQDIYIIGRSVWGTMLFRYQKSKIHPIFLLSSKSGDNAYPGIIYRDEMLWVSFYGKSPYGHSIFFAKLPIGDLAHE